MKILDYDVAVRGENIAPILCVFIIHDFGHGATYI
jgi:hypothetical protein